uniref:Uncharacterized protein n=1 Tax=Anguilla anguilla TaxID=7936 RepID=A0A0E9W8Z8_ANGAN
MYMSLFLCSIFVHYLYTESHFYTNISLLMYVIIFSQYLLHQE